MNRNIYGALLASLLSALWGHAQTPSLSVRGRITTDKDVQSIRVQLESLKSKGSPLTVMTNEMGGYEFRDLVDRNYGLTVWLDGKKQDRRNIEIVCRSGTAMTKDFFYGDTDSTLTFYFPGDDPDVVDAVELEGDYPRDVLREYEKAGDDFTNGNIPRAVQRLEAILVRAPGFYGAHSRLGMIFQQKGCYSDSETEFRLASEISPKSAQPLVNLASVQILATETAPDRMLMIEQALETLRKAISLKPNSAIAHCLSGAAHVKAASFSDAETSFKRALDLNSRMFAARLMLARVYMEQKNWQEALKHLNAYLDEGFDAPSRSAVKELRKKAEQNLKALGDGARF